MTFNPTQLNAALSNQAAAAQDPAREVRLVAGPGTGKSSAIEQRVAWLLRGGVMASGIAAVSFTRASAADLRGRVHSHCAASGLPGGRDVSVSTLHALALRSLRKAGLLAAYPSEPLVLDDWERDNVFDSEFGHANHCGKSRREEIRRDHEAFWSTGQWDPSNYIPPDPPISAEERSAFGAFHKPRTHTYSAVLPGEIVRECVEHIRAGILNPVTLLQIEHLIVDEYQDLNSMDLELIDELHRLGASLFVGGDDDQSIYSFRFASPAGIQNFTTKYPGAGDHALLDCFRCAPAIVNTANAVIGRSLGIPRIPKALQSLYSGALPPVRGTVLRCRFPSGASEAKAVAKSCRSLIDEGLDPAQILVLLSQKALGRAIRDALAEEGVSATPSGDTPFRDSAAGRFVLAACRIVLDTNDYVAHRAVLGLIAGVGVGTCDAIARSTLANNLNYRDLFHSAAVPACFGSRETKALDSARKIVSDLAGWTPDDTLSQRSSNLSTLVASVGSAAPAEWGDYLQALPDFLTLSELVGVLLADSPEDMQPIVTAAAERVGEPLPESQLEQTQSIRILTMHGAKGLAARVVFIPGLEEEILPGSRRRPYVGLVAESARLLYVSVTRARAACVLSYATNRLVNGKPSSQTPSQLLTSVGGSFGYRQSGLDAQELARIMEDCARL